MVGLVDRIRLTQNSAASPTPSTTNTAAGRQNPARFRCAIGPSMMAWMTSGNARPARVAQIAVRVEPTSDGTAGRAYG